MVISEDPNNIGKFFGEIDGTILNSLEQNHVFKKIKIYDYQAICLENADDGSPANILLTPFKLISWVFNWILGTKYFVGKIVFLNILIFRSNGLDHHSV